MRSGAIVHLPTRKRRNTPKNAIHHFRHPDEGRRLATRADAGTTLDPGFRRDDGEVLLRFGAIAHLPTWKRRSSPKNAIYHFRHPGEGRGMATYALMHERRWIPAFAGMTVW